MKAFFSFFWSASFCKRTLSSNLVGDFGCTKGAESTDMKFGSSDAVSFFSTGAEITSGVLIELFTVG
jgi:hypothetical protein